MDEFSRPGEEDGIGGVGIPIRHVRSTTIFLETLCLTIEIEFQSIVVREQGSPWCR